MVLRAGKTGLSCVMFPVSVHADTRDEACACFQLFKHVDAGFYNFFRILPSGKKRSRCCHDILYLCARNTLSHTFI